jgi:hypothetical protein
MAVMRLARFGPLLLACAASGFVGSCGAEDKSGACTGQMNGAYFRLEFGNFLDNTSLDIRINGRFIGNVGKASHPPTDPQMIEGKVKRLGEFPVCDKMEIDAKGSGGTSTTRVCSRPRILSPECSTQADFCWKTFVVEPSTPCAECLPFSPAAPQCPCIDDWEPC